MFKDKTLNASSPNASSPNAPKCGIEHFEGFCIDLASHIAKEIKQEFNICIVPDDMYGAQLDNGSWNGMLGQVVRQVLRHVQGFIYTFICSLCTVTFHLFSSLCTLFDYVFTLT